MKKGIFILLIFLITTCVFAEHKAEKEKLNKIIAQIKSVKNLLTRNKHEEKNLQTELTKTNLSIQELSQELQLTQKNLYSQKLALNLLLEKKNQLEKNVEHNRQQLAEQIRLSYMLNPEKNYLKIVLNNEDPIKIDRLLTYSRYINAYRLSVIESLKHNVDELQTQQTTINQKSLDFKKLQEKQLQSQQQLVLQKQKHATLLNDIQAQYKTNSQKLTTLLESKKALENTIKQLQKIKINTNFLTHHKGKYPWPLQGKILENYGANIAHSELKQNGIVIGATSSANVAAVAPGKVIFANQLPGYGLLIIIAHSQNYMSLYGNNSVLFKKVNDVVKAGDIVGTAGKKPGQDIPSLYFSVRKDGAPINPAQFCG